MHLPPLRTPSQNTNTIMCMDATHHGSIEQDIETQKHGFVCSTHTGNNKSTDKECVLMIVFFNSYRVSHLANSPQTTALSYRISTTAKHLFFIIIFNFFDFFEPTVGSVSSSLRVTSSQTPNKEKYQILSSPNKEKSWPIFPDALPYLCQSHSHGAIVYH